MNLKKTNKMRALKYFLLFGLICNLSIAQLNPLVTPHYVGNHVLTAKHPVSIGALQNCDIYGWAAFGFPAYYLDTEVSDEFNGTSLDLSKWGSGYGWGDVILNPNAGNHWSNPANIHLDGTGYLGLSINREPRTGLPGIGPNGDVQYVDRDYSIGNIYSKNKFGYGYYEIRAVIPQINMLWPAFWLFGDHFQELDVFEFADVSTQTKPNCTPPPNDQDLFYVPDECASSHPYFTAHFPNYDPNPQSASLSSAMDRIYSNWEIDYTPLDLSQGCEYDADVDINFHDDWHTYGLLFDPDKIVWFIDGIALRVLYKYTTDQYGDGSYTENYCTGTSVAPTLPQLYEYDNFPSPANLMNVHIGNGIVNTHNYPLYNNYRWVDNWFDWPDGFFNIDYFRYYRLVGNCDVWRGLCTNDASYMNIFGGLVRGGLIDIGDQGNSTCNFIMDPSSPLKCKASVEVGIEKFEAPIGTEFSAEIGTCDANHNIFRSQGLVNNKNDTLIVLHTPSEIYTEHKPIYKKEDKKRGEMEIGNVTIFPNPAKDYIEISLLNNKELPIVELHDMLGGKISTFTIDGTKSTIQLNGVSAGTYLLRFIYSNGVLSKKLVIL